MQMLFYGSDMLHLPSRRPSLVLYSTGKEVAVLLTQSDYDMLMAVSSLDGGCYPESRKPGFMTVSHESYLLESGLLERRTLIPPETEPEHPDGESSIHVSFIGFREMALFEKELSDKKYQMIQFAITAFLAFLAVPGAIEWMIRVFQFFSKP